MTAPFRPADINAHPVFNNNRAFHLAVHADLSGLLRRVNGEFEEGRPGYHFLIFRPKDLAFFVKAGHDAIEKSLIVPVVLGAAWNDLRADDISKKLCELDRHPALFAALDSALRDKFGETDIARIHQARRRDLDGAAETRLQETLHAQARNALPPPAFRLRLKR